MKKLKLWQKNLILVAIAVAIAALPLIFLKDAEFAGADSLAQDAITQIAPDYEPWFNSLIELPSGEVESLMFALQAAIGAGIIGFVLGKITTVNKEKTEE